MKFSVIVACTQRDQGIGFKNKIPWKIQNDMETFKKTTTETKEGFINAVIMGRKTWESIPKRFRPLPDRLNVVLSKNDDFQVPEGVMKCVSLKNALTTISNGKIPSDKIFVIGGEKLYKEAISSPLCEDIYLTQVYSECQCDVYFPKINPHIFELISCGPILSENNISYQFLVYKRRHEEYQYLDLVKEVIDSGYLKQNRTGIPTFSHFGRSMRFNLRDGVFPLLTTKEVFFRGVVEELLWLMRGQTDSKILSSKRIKIWDANGSRENLDKMGFTSRNIGDLGPIYGHQWRHFGAPYIDCETDYKGQGFDQLEEVINKLKNNPNDRRIILCSWNPQQLHEMVLPPCHVFCQFYVADGELSCLMYQRSCDLGLGIPFNIASYALLTYIIAQICGYTPGDFIHDLGDTHVYQNHVDPLRIQLSRIPKKFPLLQLNREKMTIEDFTTDDFTLTNYEPHDKIQMEMAV